MEALGMYAIVDPAYPRVTVGKYTICRQDENSVWIDHEDGEGAQFSNDTFEKAIAAFYDANF